MVAHQFLLKKLRHSNVVIENVTKIGTRENLYRLMTRWPNLGFNTTLRRSRGFM